MIIALKPVLTNIYETDEHVRWLYIIINKVLLKILTVTVFFIIGEISL